MKNLTKIFVAVAVLVAVSCTTDVTEDLGVAVGGQTEFVLSLEESRTQLGDKAGEVYPLYWSEGDKISVNGVESAPLASGNSAVATFTVSGAISTPYCIAYPAANAGEVVFAAEQSYVEGTFSNGASTMYGYSENGGGLALNHLTGVLKIGVIGDKTLSYAQISNVSRAPIAGAFALDFTNGELTATSASKELIGYSFGEGVALSSTPTYLHVAVPAGVYDALYVTLYDTEGGAMYATVKANDEKPLAAGKVREFSNSIVYTPNSAVFVVKDAESLKAFAAQATDSAKDVLFVADVDMTGEEWTPIEGYAKNVLGNGYAIKGLTAPLFGTTSASIKGLHLKDVVLNSNSATHYGALACKVVATDATTPTIEHCSVSGTLTVENKEYAPIDGSAAKTKYANDDAKASEMAYGGLVGLSCGATLNNCVGNVAITVLQIAKDGDTMDVVPAIGGITGNAFYAAVTEGKVFTNLVGCENNGHILYKDNSCTTEKWEVYPAIGGITGAVYHNTGLIAGTNLTGVSIRNCTNRGNVTMQAISGGLSQDTQGYPQTQVGGVVGRGAYISMSGCKNYGKVTIDGTFRQAHVGGVAGSSYYSDVLDCHNYGEVKVTENSSFFGISCAGLAAMNYSTADYTFRTEDCSNNAPVSCFGSTHPDANVGGTWHYRIGGIESFGRSFAKNCVNNKEGVITIKGNILNTRKTDMFCEVGGVCAYRTTCAWEGCKNYADIISEINFSNKEGVENNTASVTDRSFFVGGVGGYSSQMLNGCENHGNIIVKGSYSGEKLYVGGVGGFASLNNTTNYGTVTIDESCTTNVERIHIGGVIGGNDSTDERVDVANYGEVHVGGSHTAAISIGGIAGQCRHGGYKWVNNSDIYITASASNVIYIGGVIGQFTRHYAKSNVTVDEGTNGPLRECTNNGNIYANFVNGTSNHVHIGGVCRQCQHTMSSCVNNGDAFVSGNINGSLYFGGLCTANSACLRENSINNGNLTVSAANLGNSTSTGSDCFLGGLCYSGGSNTTYRNCVNNGNITVESDVAVANCCRIGGLIANVETASKTNIIDACENNGNILVKANTSAQSAGVVRIGGMFGHFTNGTVKILNGFKNTGNVEYAGYQMKDSGTSIGGIIGGGTDGGAWSTESTGNIINEGTISFTGKTVGSFYIGGFSAFMNYTVPAAPIKIINTGKIVATGTAKSYTNATISGVCGNLKAPIDNAECFCDIFAPGYGSAEIGLLSGKVHSATVTYTNAKVGGRICTEYDEEDESEKWVTIDGSNYLGLIYKMSGTPLTEEQAAADGITIITSKDQIDYTTLPVPTPEAGTEE